MTQPQTENSGKLFNLSRLGTAAEPAAEQSDDETSDRKCDAMLVRKFFKPTVFNIADAPESA
jgi:hypothetical protein